MGSTSSEGQGHGAAVQTKGPGNNREIYKPKVTTEVVLAGRGVTNFATGLDTISFAPLDGGYNGTFVAHVTAESVNFSAGIDSLSSDGDGNFNGFTVATKTAGDKDTSPVAASAWYVWSIIKKGVTSDPA